MLLAQARIVLAFSHRQGVSRDGQDVSTQLMMHGGIVWQEPKAAAMASAMRIGVNILRFTERQRSSKLCIYVSFTISLG